MDRLTELRNLFADLDDPARSVVMPLLEEIVYLEDRLAELKTMPMIKVHPSDPAKQKQTQAARQYREVVQQYNGCVKTLLTCCRKGDAGQTSPLREGLQKLLNLSGSNL